MKLILNILIVVAKMCASESFVYDWHVRTLERGSDFSEDLKMQTALNNERQQDLLKMSGKTNSYFNPFNRHTNAKEKYQTSFRDKIDLKPIFDLPSNYTRNKVSKKVKTNYGHYIDYDYNEDYPNKQRTTKNVLFDDHQRRALHEGDREEFLKHLPYDDQNKYRNLDLSPKSFNILIGQDENNKRKQMNGIGNDNVVENKNAETENSNFKNKQTFNKYEKDLNKNEEMAVITKFPDKNVEIESFVGTNLFDSTAKKCFSTEDVALLAIRRDFESLIPKDLPQSLFDDNMVELLMNYFYICHQMVVRTTSDGFRHLAQKAFYDTLGGYLNFYMVPVTKYSYYAGQVSLNTAQQILNLHKESKKFLNTNGNGWKAPLQNVLRELKSAHIEPFHIPDLNENLRNEPSFCMQLSMNTGENQPDNDKMIVELPKLDAENVRGFLGNLWLPFQRKRTFDLKSENSAYIVLKFYESVTKCYHFENINQEFYNEKFKTWLLEKINSHLSDNEFYPGLGAVLRIYEYLKTHEKYFIEIGADLSENGIKYGEVDKYLNHQIRSMHLPNGRNKSNESKEKYGDSSKSIGNILKESDQNSIELIKANVGHEANETTEINDKLEDSVQKYILKTFDFSSYQIAIIAVPLVFVILVIIICCWKYFCKKKAHGLYVKPRKNSSSSSSNLLNSPVRFFHIRKKTASGTPTRDYSSNEAGNKKNKKSVKIEKKTLLNSDSSASNSPVRKKKSKEKGKSKDSGKSNVEVNQVGKPPIPQNNIPRNII